MLSLLFCLADIHALMDCIILYRIYWKVVIVLHLALAMPDGVTLQLATHFCVALAMRPDGVTLQLAMQWTTVSSLKSDLEPIQT